MAYKICSNFNFNWLWCKILKKKWDIILLRENIQSEYEFLKIYNYIGFVLLRNSRSSLSLLIIQFVCIMRSNWILMEKNVGFIGLNKQYKDVQHFRRTQTNTHKEITKATEVCKKKPKHYRICLRFCWLTTPITP